MDLRRIFIEQVTMILYHGRCADGTSASWVFWRENKNTPQANSKPLQELGTKVSESVRSTSTKFIECLHDRQKPPIMAPEEVVVILDFCYNRETIVSMAKKVKYILILDHHKTNEFITVPVLPSNVYYIFDTSRSACQIAWNYVYPGVEYPWFIDIITQRDLWAWKDADSKKLSQALYEGRHYTFTALEKLYSQSQTPGEIDILKKQLISTIKRYPNNDREVAMAFRKSFLTEMTMPNGDKYKVRLATCPKRYRSEIGNKLSEGCDFAVIWEYDFLTNEWWCCARASQKSDIDLASITSQFGGGGHEKAAGFAIRGKDGHNLHTYFRCIEVPPSRQKDAKLMEDEALVSKARSGLGQAQSFFEEKNSTSSEEAE